MILEQVFSADRVILKLESEDKEELFEEMVQCMVTSNPSINREEAIRALQERESKMSTGIMHSIAVPHGNAASVKGVIGAIGISRTGIEYQSLDKAPVHLVFMLLCSPQETEAHLEVLKELAAVLQHPSFIKEIMDLNSQEDVYRLLCEYEARLGQ